MNKTAVMMKFLLYYSPCFFRKALKNIQMKREIHEGFERAKRTKVTKKEFTDLISRLNLSGDIFLHTSMMNIGKVEGGAKFISNTILSQMDLERQTLLISALPYRGSFYEYLKQNPIFDVRTAGVAMGAVNEILANRTDSFRSIHPTHSVVAIGKHAREYTATHHLDDTPFGPHSPYIRIFENNGKILLLGATLNNVTAIHALEDLLADQYPVDIYYKHLFKVRCVDKEGNELTVLTKCHHPLKCLFRDVNVMRKALENSLAMQSYPLGESELILIDATKFAACYFDMLSHGFSIYGKRHIVTDSLLKAISEARKKLGINDNGKQ